MKIKNLWAVINTDLNEVCCFVNGYGFETSKAVFTNRKDALKYKKGLGKGLSCVKVIKIEINYKK